MAKQRTGGGWNDISLKSMDIKKVSMKTRTVKSRNGLGLALPWVIFHCQEHSVKRALIGKLNDEASERKGSAVFRGCH